MTFVLARVLLLSFCVIRAVLCEFQLFSENHLPWRSYHSPYSSDCRISSLWRRFPELFQGQTTEQPHNFTATYFEREALELGGLLDYFYPGITVEFYPAYETSQSTRGYQVLLRKNRQTTCLVIVIPANSFVERVTQELFPMTGSTHYRISYISLPPSLPGNSINQGYFNVDEAIESQVHHVVTGRFGDYRPAGRHTAPADWIATIHYMVNSYENGTGQSLDVVFSRPPSVYNFRRFQVALVPVEDYIQIQIDVTTDFWHVFPDVRPGHYRISVKPLDDYFSVAGQCLCYHDNKLCTNCLTSETEIFTVG